MSTKGITQHYQKKSTKRVTVNEKSSFADVGLHNRETTGCSHNEKEVSLLAKLFQWLIVSPFLVAAHSRKLLEKNRNSQT